MHTLKVDSGMTLGDLIEAHVTFLIEQGAIPESIKILDVTINEDQRGCIVLLSNDECLEIDWDADLVHAH